MNIYHISYAPAPKIIYLHFWGCNLSCRAYLCQKEIHDCHLKETKDAIFNPQKATSPAPELFLNLTEMRKILSNLNAHRVIFMGAEPTIDPQLPELAKILHQEFHTYNVLLTSGMKMPELTHIDAVVFSIKAYTDSFYREYTSKSNRKALHNFISIYETDTKLMAERVSSSLNILIILR